MSICVDVVPVNPSGTFSVGYGATPYSQILVPSSAQVSPCPSYVLLDKLEQDQFNLLLSQSGINWDTVYQAFGYGLGLFLIGAGCGLLLNVARKLK